MTNLQLRNWPTCSALIWVISCACLMCGCSPPANNSSTNNPSVTNPSATNSSDPEFVAGMAAYTAKDYKEALTHFSKGKTAAAYLFSGFALGAMNQPQRAYKYYEIVTTSFKGSPEAKTAANMMETLKPQLGQTSTATATIATATPAATKLMDRIVVNPPGFNHPAVSKASIQAAQQAIAALPKPLRARLDASNARVIISPNMIDRWPDSIKDLPENFPAPTLAELPGRIYDLDMCVYERAKVRGTTALKEARAPAFIRLQVANMCFQLLDDMMTISKSPALRTAWESDKAAVPASMVPKLATFMKTDDWGPRETCSELFGSMMGGRDENTDNLYRYFPRTKKWLIEKMGITGQ